MDTVPLTQEEKDIVYLQQCLDGHNQTIAELRKEVWRLTELLYMKGGEK
jgi:hypothetical protein